MCKNHLRLCIKAAEENDFGARFFSQASWHGHECSYREDHPASMRRSCLAARTLSLVQTCQVTDRLVSHDASIALPRSLGRRLAKHSSPSAEGLIRPLRLLLNATCCDQLLVDMRSLAMNSCLAVSLLNMQQSLSLNPNEISGRFGG